MVLLLVNSVSKESGFEMLTFVNKYQIFYYTGRLSKGIQLFETPLHPLLEEAASIKHIEAEPYQVAYVNGHFLLLNTDFSKSFRKDGQVISSFGKGIIIEIADKVALVRLNNGDEKVFYTDELSKDIDDLRALRKALSDYHSIKSGIKAQLLIENSINIRTELDALEKAFKDEGLSLGNKNPEHIDTSSGSVKFTDKVKSFLKFGKKKEPAPVPPVNVKTSVDKNKIIDLDTGNESALNSSIETPSKEHKLVHVNLNPNFSGNDDKYTYHYKVGNDIKQSSQLLDKTGELTTSHNELSDKVFIPGEKIIHNNKLYNVKSHISPLHTGQNKMLLTDDNGQHYSASRNKVKLYGPDLRNSNTVQLGNGKRKFHHEVTAGDKILHNGEPHEVLRTGSWGYAASKDGDIYAHLSKDFHKPFKHNEFNPNKKAEVEDMIEFTHMGGKKIREVIKVDDHGAIVQVNKNSDPIRVKHGEYNYTGQKAHEKYVPPIEKPGEDEIERPSIGYEEFEKKLRGYSSPHSNPAFERELTAMDRLVKKNNRISKLGENSYKYRLGIGDVTVTVSNDPKTNKLSTEIENQNIEIPTSRKNKHYFKVVSVDPHSGLVEIKDRSKATTRKFHIDDLKDMAFVNTKILKESKGENVEQPKVIFDEDESKEHLLGKLSSVFEKEKNVDKDHRGTSTGDTIHNIFNEYAENVNRARRGTDILEPDDYDPIALNYNESGNKLFDEHLGNDWKDQIASRIKKRDEYRKVQEESARQRKEADKHLKNVSQHNRELEKKDETEYIDKVYNTLKDINDISHNQKEGIEGKRQSMSTKSPKYDGLDSVFHLVEADDLITSDNPTGAHKNRHTNKIKDVWKIPFEQNSDFPPSGAQLRNYNIGQDAEKNVKHTIDMIADRHRPSEIFNDSPEVSDNTPIVDAKGVVMGGNGRVNGHRLKHPDLLSKNKEAIKERLNLFFNLNDEKKKKLSKMIDGMDNPMIARLAHNKDGSPYHFGEHTSEYKEFTTEINNPSNKQTSEQEKSLGEQSKLSLEHREDLYNLVPKGQNINRVLSNPTHAHRALDYLLKKQIISPDERSTYFDNSKGLTASGKNFLKNIYEGGYLSPDSEKNLGKLKEEHRIKFQDFKNSNITNLMNLRLNNKSFDLKTDIEQAIKSLVDEQGQLPGQQKLIKDSIPVKGVKHILENMNNEEQKEVVNKFVEGANNLVMQSKQGLFSVGVDELENFKNHFFKKHAEEYDYLKKKGL